MLCSDSSRLLISAQHIQSGPDTVNVLSYATHRVVVQTSCQCRNSFPMAANSSSANMANIITALGNAFKDPSGATMSNDRLAAVLLQNMNQLTDLAKQGKLNQQQIMQVRQPASSFIICEFPAHHFFSFSSFVRQLRDYADKHKPATTKQVRCFFCDPVFFFQLQKPYSYVPPPDTCCDCSPWPALSPRQISRPSRQRREARPPQCSARAPTQRTHTRSARR